MGCAAANKSTQPMAMRREIAHALPIVCRVVLVIVLMVGWLVATAWTACPDRENVVC